MTNEEKRKLAIQRELDELVTIVEGFRSLAESARAEAAELEKWALRMDALRDETRIDIAIADLEALHEERRKRDRLTRVLTFPHYRKETD